jgi:arylsulfatase
VTVLEAAGIPEPVIVNSVQQMPLQGTSMVYSFDDALAAERHEIQYFEMFVNRGIYHKGWTAVTRHSTPWDVAAKNHPYDEDVWECMLRTTVAGARPVQREARQTQGITAVVPDRGSQVQRLSTGRPPH